MFNRNKVKKLRIEITYLKEGNASKDKAIAELTSTIAYLNKRYDTLLLDKNEQIRLQGLRIEVLTRTNEIGKKKAEPKLVGKDLKTGKFKKI